MRRHEVYSLVCAASVLGLLSGLAQGADTSPVLVSAPVEKVFVPLGFDDNDNVEVIVHGHFPDTCYKTGPIKAHVDEAARTIDVTVQAYRYRDAKCGLRLVPFIQAVEVGPLSAGRYAVLIEGRELAETQALQVVKATLASPDDFTYAPVDSLVVETDAEGHATMVLSGKYPYSQVDCMILKEVRTTKTPDDVLVVQPIVTFETGEVCEPWYGLKSFRYRLKLGDDLLGKEYLAHIRVMNGESLNQLVDISE